MQARKTWREYSGNVDGIIFMVDAADLERLPEAKEELDNVRSLPELKKIPKVVFGNKCDRKEALEEQQFRDRLGLEYHKTKGKDAASYNPQAEDNLEVFMCSVKLRAGYADGFDWLSNQLD